MVRFSGGRLSSQLSFNRRSKISLKTHQRNQTQIVRP